jgi:hypothetical protein
LIINVLKVGTPCHFSIIRTNIPKDGKNKRWLALKGLRVEYKMSNKKKLQKRGCSKLLGWLMKNNRIHKYYRTEKATALRIAPKIAT